MPLNGFSEEGRSHSFVVETDAVHLDASRIALPPELIGKVVARFSIDPPVSLADGAFNAQLDARFRNEVDDSAAIALTAIHGVVGVFGATIGRVVTTRWNVGSAIRLAGMLAETDRHHPRTTWRTHTDEGQFVAQFPIAPLHNQ